MKRTYRKPDRKAPRFRPKKVNILNKATYEKFIERYPEYEELSLEGFKNIVKTFNELLTDGIVDNRDGVELPVGLGYIFMGTCPAAKENIDKGKAIEYGFATNHKNWDSDNNLLKIFYTNYSSRYPFENKQVWSFKGVRSFRKKASDEYKKSWQKYIVVDPMRKISSLYARIRKKEVGLERGKHVPEDYNEFNI